MINYNSPHSAETPKSAARLAHHAHDEAGATNRNVAHASVAMLVGLEKAPNFAQAALGLSQSSNA